MTAKDFRELPLALPEAVEEAHMDHPDFRVRGKIFATLDRDECRGMVKLTPAQQSELVGDAPEIFQPCNGAWGRKGCTYVILQAADQSTARAALLAAWCNTAPKRLVANHLQDP